MQTNKGFSSLKTYSIIKDNSSDRRNNYEKKRKLMLKFWRFSYFARYCIRMCIRKLKENRLSLLILNFFHLHSLPIQCTLILAFLMLYMRACSFLFSSISFFCWIKQNVKIWVGLFRLPFWRFWKCYDA